METHNVCLPLRQVAKDGSKLLEQEHVDICLDTKGYATRADLETAAMTVAHTVTNFKYWPKKMMYFHLEGKTMRIFASEIDRESPVTSLKEVLTALGMRHVSDTLYIHYDATWFPEEAKDPYGGTIYIGHGKHHDKECEHCKNHVKNTAEVDVQKD